MSGGARASPKWKNTRWGFKTLCNAHTIKMGLVRRSDRTPKLNFEQIYAANPTPQEPIDPMSNTEYAFLNFRLANLGKPKLSPRSRGGVCVIVSI